MATTQKKEITPCPSREIRPLTEAPINLNAAPPTVAFGGRPRPHLAARWLLVRRSQGLPAAVSAVDEQVDAGDVAGGRAQQEQDGAGDLVRFG